MLACEVVEGLAGHAVVDGVGGGDELVAFVEDQELWGVDACRDGDRDGDGFGSAVFAADVRLADPQDVVVADQEHPVDVADVGQLFELARQTVFLGDSLELLQAVGAGRLCHHVILAQ